VDDPARLWALFPSPVALVSFPPVTPDDVLTAARKGAYLPPGVSRHIVHGRAVRLNYPLDALRATTRTLEEKNADLTAWVREKMAQRRVRYYAESTYQFDE
jgi:hypothetical protein